MDYVFDTLLALHLLSLALAGATAVAMPIVMGKMRGATADGAQLLQGIGGRLSLNGRIAGGVLLLTGLLMIWWRFGGVDGLGVWFWVKMALVVVLFGAMIAAGASRGRINPKLLSWVTRLSLLGIVIAAVLAFN